MHFFHLLKRFLKDVNDFDSFNLFLGEKISDRSKDTSCLQLKNWKDTTHNFLWNKRKGSFEPNEMTDYIYQIRLTVHNLIKRDRQLFDEIRDFFIEK